MSEAFEREVLRDLRGELGAEASAALRRRLAEDPELRERAGRLEESWRSLAAPPDSALPPGFAQRVLARAREDGRSDLSWSLLPSWAKAVAVLALVSGIAAGAGLVVISPPAAGPVLALDGEGESFDTMAENYVAALETEAAADAALERP